MKWINVKTRLPRQGKEVLIQWRNLAGLKVVSIGTKWTGQHSYNPKEWHFNYCDVDGTNQLDDSQVTHWQPLPKTI